ncbi:peptidoglycan recognition protein family protein [Photobacterium chitinilyticum]|uniref:Peptidoglycan-binding domain-containing protein n=1 Tax=Photobacterium chitinilyticum TaxID=2485123 RepID=A0A444JT42_9GAMM|nr:peptidoglycan-binding domain-containing protein [Photobacterium chitinilyticum]RWX56223.1 peptidoglycan-binding domain-containing protein [Photobacterium chitinilyticum]
MTFIKPNRHIEKVFIHCSASDYPQHDNVETMRKWHLERGWQDVGYHYFIRKNGQLDVGRDLEKIPAAQSGHNKNSIAICLHGLKKELFTKKQFESLIDLCKLINKAYEEQIVFRGHREVSDKNCPVFDYQKILGLSNFGEMDFAPNAQPTENPSNIYQETLKLTSRGAAVLALQKLLNQKQQIALVEDGIFGQQTKSAVMAFQEQKNTAIDGIVGPVTWHCLTSND